HGDDALGRRTLLGKRPPRYHLRGIRFRKGRGILRMFRGAYARLPGTMCPRRCHAARWEDSGEHRELRRSASPQRSTRHEFRDTRVGVSWPPSCESCAASRHEDPRWREKRRLVDAHASESLIDRRLGRIVALARAAVAEPEIAG